MSQLCEKCGKDRTCEFVKGPGFEKGMWLCRKCHKWMKKMLEAIKTRVVEIDTNIDQEAANANEGRSSS